MSGDGRGSDGRDGGSMGSGSSRSGLEEMRGEGWLRLLAAARRRLERTSGALDGDIGLTAPSEAERRVVIGVTGAYRAQETKRITVHLGDLDLALRRRHGVGLLATLAALDGRPVRDRAAERSEEEHQIDDAGAKAATSRLAAHGWYTDWLAALAADGTLTRLARRGDLVQLALAATVLERLIGTDRAVPIPLPVLAEWCTGDTKALVPGSPLATLVLRALARRTGTSGVPRDRAGQRALWESAGAVGDDLASQVLLLNVRCGGDTVVNGWLNDAADFGIPFRLTLQQQAADPVLPDVPEIYVCENPAVLAVAAAELSDACPPLVCTEGIPSAACHKLLGQAVRHGARLRWRADFDWTGLRITADGLARHRAVPWRMSADDYRTALADGGTTPLTGSPAASPWDPSLTAALTAEGRAVMEERLLTTLLADLRTTPQG
ncbi:uncharacterized protein (TIGR02679 family) [Streptomyces sp. 846.5]|nr:TIGR02679 family protein [Streptomyces sp. 846.5]TDU05348.1 uncharacterized protein (TIGR02679 family) [Streptomyces sp. 846.5]